MFSLTMKPMSFFKNTWFYRKNMSRKDLLNSLSVGFFYERFNFGSAQFNGTRLSDFTGENFNKTYRIDHRFGFKIGFSFY